jgi:hypothetical protein
MLLDFVFGWGIWIGMLLWIVASLSTVWIWGGSRRNALGQLAAGLLQIVSGTLFIHVSLINVYARMDNAYLSNAWFGGTLVISGMILLFASLVGYRVPLWLAGLLLAVYVAFAFFGYSALVSMFPFRDSGTLLYPAILIGGILLYILIRGYVLDGLIAVALAGVGWALVWTIYGAGLDAFTPVDSISYSISEPIVKPPVLDLGPFLACLLIAAILYVGGHFFPRLWRRETPRGVSPEPLVSGS